MKKLLVSVLAIAGLVACSQEQTLVSKSPASMEFGVASLDKATRVDPSLTTDNLQGFNVWAWMDSEDGNVLTKEAVERMGDGWGYVNTAYWLPGHNYSFAALAPMDSESWTYNIEDGDIYGKGNTIDFTNIDGTEDLIYAFNTRSTVGDAVGKDYAALDLTFNHLLSKTKFTFVNGFATNNVTLQVRDVQVKVSNKATYTVDGAKGTWGAVAGEQITLAYGDTEVIAAGDKCAVADERLTIPAAAETSYEITYTVQVWYGKEPGFEGEGLTKKTTLTGWEFVQGKAYNFVAEITPESLNLDEIEFEIEVIKWDEQDVNVGQIEDEVKFVYTIEELQDTLDAATGDTTVVLGDNLAGNVTVPELENATIAIYGNGKKFDGTFALVGGSTYGKGTTVFDGINFETAALNGYDAFIYCNEQNGNTRYPDNVTIKNCTFKGTDTAVAAKFRSLNGNLVVENCKAEGIHSMLQLLSCGEAVVLVDGAEVVNCGRGFSLQNSTNTIRNTKVVADSYGVRLEGGVATTTIEKSTIEAKQPVVVRKVTTAGYTVNIDEASVITRTGDYDVIFTEGNDDAAYVAPAVDFTFNGPADLVVFPEVVVVRTAEEIAAALKSDTQKINVKLANDIEVAISEIGTTASGDAKQMGGANTKAITIDLNDNKLNLTTTYWSVLGAKNSDAIVTIKNGTMTSSQTTGTWNSYDLSFSNCNYAFENVVFEKAIALEAANKSYNLKNVTINETHDYYAMWITAEGQNVTIDGLTVNSLGRGIKIDEQYVDAPAKVTLNIANATFKTANKAAILVKSVAGAEINVEGINISNVAKDTEFAVWVDEDAAAYADKVVVNGALVKVEGSNAQVVASNDELTTAVNNGATKVYLADGTYTLAKYPAGLELVGYGDNVVLGVQGKKYGVNGNVTIENVKLVFSNDNYTGFQHTNVESYKNCTIVGQPFLYGNDVTFEGCTFEQTSADAYNVWTYGAKAVKFVDCVFNSAGKSVLIYTESGNGQTVLFEGCKLNASAPVEGKAAIEIDSSLISGLYEITINDTTATGFANGNVSGNSLWNNKKGDKTTITVDGVKVL